MNAVDIAACTVNTVIRLHGTTEIRDARLCLTCIVSGKLVLVIKNKAVMLVLICKYRAFSIDIVLIILVLIEMIGRYVRNNGNIGLAYHAVQLKRAELKNGNIVFAHIVNIAKQRPAYIAAEVYSAALSL